MAYNYYNRKFFIITGDPGIGKTTLIKKLVTSLADEGVRASGFYIDEVRSNNTIEGFDIVTLDGVRGRLARDVHQLDGNVKYRVGNYGVLVKEFEAVAIPCLEKTVRSPTHLIVIDEIGIMELLSASFKSKIKDIFSQATKNMVLATIPFKSHDTFIDQIRNGDIDATTEIWVVTDENRNDIEKDVIKEIKATLRIR